MPDRVARPRWPRRKPKQRAARASDLLGLAAAWLPYEETPLRERHAPVEQQRKYRQYQDAGEDCIDVESAFGLKDEIADAAGRAQIFADHGAHEGKPHRIVQAREYPAHRARYVHVAQELPVARAQDARV